MVPMSYDGLSASEFLPASSCSRPAFESSRQDLYVNHSAALRTSLPAVRADSTGYSLSNLPQGADAFATVFSYEALSGDSAHTNDFRRVRTESRYAVAGGSAVLVSRTWRRYVHSETNGLPVVTVETVRARSQSAAMDDPGNAVSSETAYDAESGLVPYVLACFSDIVAG